MDKSHIQVHSESNLFEPRPHNGFDHKELTDLYQSFKTLPQHEGNNQKGLIESGTLPDFFLVDTNPFDGSKGLDNAKLTTNPNRTLDNAQHATDSNKRLNDAQRALNSNGQLTGEQEAMKSARPEQPANSHERQITSEPGRRPEQAQQTINSERRLNDGVPIMDPERRSERAPQEFSPRNRD